MNEVKLVGIEFYKLIPTQEMWTQVDSQEAGSSRGLS